MTNKQILQEKEETLRRLYLQLGVAQLQGHLSRSQWQLSSIEQDLPDTNYSKEHKEKINQRLKQMFQTLHYLNEQTEILQKLLKQTLTKETTHDNKTKKQTTKKNR